MRRYDVTGKPAQMVGMRALVGLGLLALSLSLVGCGEGGGGTDSLAPAAANPAQLTPSQQIEQLIEIIGNASVPSEMRAFAVQTLADYEPSETVDPLVAMLAADDPLVLVAVIEHLPQAAEQLATPELEALSAKHPVPEVQAAARSRLAQFKAFHE